MLDAGTNGLTRDTQRDATFQEVRRLKEENDALKRAVAETVLDNQRLKKVWACKAQEVSANGWRIQTGSSTSRGGLRAAGNTSAGSASDTPLDLLPVASELSSTRSARLARSSIFPQPGLDQVLPSERDKTLEIALLYPEWSPREVSWHITDHCGFTISESSVYRILKAEGSDPGSSAEDLSSRLRIWGQDRLGKPAMADRRDVSTDQELGLVLPDLGTGRLQPQDPGLAAATSHDSRRLQ